MSRVEPVSLTAARSATAASLISAAAGMRTGAGASGAATGVGSTECAVECKLVGADVTE